MDIYIYTYTVQAHTFLNQTNQLHSSNYFLKKEKYIIKFNTKTWLCTFTFRFFFRSFFSVHIKYMYLNLLCIQRCTYIYNTDKNTFSAAAFPFDKQQKQIHIVSILGYVYISPHNGIYNIYMQYNIVNESILCAGCVYVVVVAIAVLPFISLNITSNCCQAPYRVLHIYTYTLRCVGIYSYIYIFILHSTQPKKEKASPCPQPTKNRPTTPFYQSFYFIQRKVFCCVCSLCVFCIYARTWCIYNGYIWYTPGLFYSICTMLCTKCSVILCVYLVCI